MAKKVPPEVVAQGHQMPPRGELRSAQVDAEAPPPPVPPSRTELILKARANPLVKQSMELLLDTIGGRDGLDKIASIFSEMDTDGSGFLDHAEFAAGLTRFGMEISEEQVAGMLMLLDTDGSGTLDIEIEHYDSKTGCGVGYLNVGKDFEEHSA